MKKYFNLINNETIFALGIEKEIEKIKMDWANAKYNFNRKITPEIIKRKIKLIFEDYLLKVKAKSKEIIHQDNLDRKNGVSFQVRKINLDKIKVLHEMEMEYKKDFKVKPGGDWLTPGDLGDIKTHGLDWFLKVFYKRVLC